MSASGNGDVSQIIRDDNLLIPWLDADFQAWNSALSTPFVLSAEQIQLKAMKQLTVTQLAAATPAQIALILHRLLQATNTGVV